MKKISRWAMALLFGSIIVLGSGEAPAQDAPYVGAWEADTFFENITSEEMDVLRTKKILFASRSFGLNMYDGLVSLKNSNSMYDILSDYEDYNVFYDGLESIPTNVYDTYNFVHFLATPHPDNQRLVEFETVIRDAPYSFSEDLDVAMVYYHTVYDPTQAYIDYTNTMHQLQADYPHIKFIYVTSGLMDTNHVADNAKSATFSALIRANEQGNVPVYDLHYILNNDDACGLGYCPEYSTDPAGVHPNADFAERRMGKAFLLILRDAFFGSSCTSSVPPSVPAGLAGSGLSDASVRLSWNESIHPECFVSRYEISRNGTFIGSTHGTNYTDTGLTESTSYDYAVRSVSMADVASAYSATEAVSTLADSVAPTLVEAEALSSTQVSVEFNEALDPTTAQTASNYALDNGVSVLSASLDVDTVTLSTSEMTDGTLYTLTVNNVADASSASNPVAVDSQTTFTYLLSPYPVDPDGCWPFNGDLNDVSANANHGAWVNGTSFGTGLLQDGLSLDGSSGGSYVQIPHEYTLDGMSNLSISVWAKKDASGVGGNLFKKHVVYDFAISTAGISGYLFNEFGSRADVSSAAPINDTNWHHYCLVYNGSQFLAYVDGIEKTSSPLSAKVASNASWPIYVGKDPWVNTFAGEMDEMKLFRRALSTNEISALVTAGPAGAADRVAVRDLLDANGLTSKTVNGVSVTKNDRIWKLYIQEGGVTNITSDIGQLSELVLLHGYGDRSLGYPLLTTVAPELGNCVKLEELLLNQNDLADLPAAIANLTALSICSIGENFLCDADPAWESWAHTYDPDWRDTQNCPSPGGSLFILK